MTSLAPRVVSAISGGAHRPWHYAHTDTERHELIRRLLSEAHGHVLLYVWHRPAGGDTNQFPRQQLKIVYNAGVGAAHYANSDPEHGLVGAWLAQADQPPTDPPTVIYDPWDPERVTLPANALLPIDALREIAEDYATTRQRPTGAQWAPVEWV